MARTFSLVFLLGHPIYPDVSTERIPRIILGPREPEDEGITFLR